MIGGEHANAEDEGAGIIIDYDTTSSHALGDPDDAANPYLNVFSTATENRLENWTDTDAAYGVISDKIVFSSSNKWQDGKMQVAGMRPVKWLEIPAGVKGSEYWGNNVYWIATDKTGKYSVKVTVLETMNDTFTNNPQPLLVGRDGNYIAVRNVYNKNCTTVGSCGDPLLVYEVDTETNNYAQVFIKLKFEITNRPRISYLQIDDIDFAQSYRIENQGVCDSSRAGTKKCDIYVKNADVSEFTVNQYNNAQENYIKYDNDNVTIFSSISPGSVIGGVVERAELFNSNDKANIYLRLQNDTQSNTINTVYGFRHDALSYWNFYAEAYNVTFNAVNASGQSLGNVLKYNSNGTVINESDTIKIYANEKISEFPVANGGAYQIDYWTSPQFPDEHINTELVKQVLAINGDYTFTAHMSRVKYPITFVDEDGTTVLKPATQYEYGTPAASIVKPSNPTKPATAGQTFTFTGWTPEITTVTGPQTYKATYSSTTNQYTVTFVDGDGTTVLKGPTLYDYNTPADSIVRPADPSVVTIPEQTCTFAGWTPTITNVITNATYKATYTCTRNTYSITFVDEDGTTVLKPATQYEYGTPAASIVKPSNPTKPATSQYRYTFAGWTPTIANVTKDQTYTATYNEVLRQYPVKFVDDEGKTLLEIEVEYGKTPSYPGDIPTKKGDKCTYEFTGWDKEFTPVTSAQIYKATFKEGKCDSDKKSSVPNTGSGSEKSIVGKVTKNTQIIPFIIAGAVGIIAAVVIARFCKHRKLTKL